jgi:transcription-repair coupling factor (superfamily II helicase)
MLDQLKSIVRATPSYRRIAAFAGERRSDPLLLAGAPGSLPAILGALLYEDSSAPICIIGRDESAAERIRDDVALLLGQAPVVHFAGHPVTLADTAKTGADLQALRSLATGTRVVMVTHPLALTQKIPPPDSVRERAISIELNGTYDLDRLRRTLLEFGFEKKEVVETHGDFAQRGGILDVFPPTGDTPIRIEFFGDMVESIRHFDPLSQRSIKDLSIAVIVADVFRTVEEDSAAETASLSAYLDSETIILLDDPDLIRGTLEHPGPTAAPVPYDEVIAPLPASLVIHVRSHGRTDGDSIDFGAVPQPAFNGSIQHLHRRLLDLSAAGTTVVLACDGHPEATRLKDLLSSINTKQEEDGAAILDLQTLTFSLESIHEGFELLSSRYAVYTEHQIFGRLRRRGKRRAAKFKGFSEKEFHQLRRGDYVVHRDYGIGRFAGLRKIRVRSAEQEVVAVQYDANDMLYVNLNYISRLQKYSSKEGHVPKLNRLGSGDWEKLKAKVKSRVKDIARSLIQLYAKRKHMPGIAFSKDTPWQKELEASFMYEDTLDQAKATKDIKADMETPNPMDRLICGDVGFGKTEVAIRAAFKAVSDGKQVAVLVPTTILAMQHLNTFSDRLVRYGVQVRVMSRFKSKKEQVAVIDELKRGAADVVIGTHRLLSKDVAFKQLGLLIIDEEHRFGVAAKEKLRMLRAGVDTLTLTATPIPRTLHFSLLGARDLSLIATPPRNRLPISTEIVQWNDDVIREAVTRELSRGGQVYFVHDRVQNMDDLTARLQEILPGVRIRHAHGQMKSTELEEVMMDFLERKFDVLVATKIIESGLDIPSVNTIIINRADRFGMAELYQLRGRVGRSNIQAHAYMITPPISILPRHTVQRLQALEEFVELGSGFNLAMRDLEIRGAGNLLGGEQSGFIETMGFETYTKILDEAIRELKEEEFKDLFAGEERTGEKGDAVVEADVDAYIPETYIEHDAERLSMYKRLYTSSGEEQLREIADELRDRFGQYPVEVEVLFAVVRVRLAALRIGFSRVRINPDGLEAEFPPESDRHFYDSAEFQHLMSAISRNKGKMSGLRQEGTVLTYFHHIPRTDDQLSPLQEAEKILTTLHKTAEQQKPPVTAEK